MFCYLYLLSIVLFLRRTYLAAVVQHLSTKDLVVCVGRTFETRHKTINIERTSVKNKKDLRPPRGAALVERPP